MWEVACLLLKRDWTLSGTVSLEHLDLSLWEPEANVAQTSVGGLVLWSNYKGLGLSGFASVAEVA